MLHDYWHKQLLSQSLYPDIAWSRPENRAFAGKLGIIGGNTHGFAAVAEAYTQASRAQVGTILVALPDSLRKSVGSIFEDGYYLPSTPSGSIAQRGIAELLDLASWSDGMLVAGDLGRNSETAIVLEQLASSYSGPLICTKDSVNYLSAMPDLIQNRAQTLLVLSFSQLQKIGTTLRLKKAFTFDMDLLRLIDMLHELSVQVPCSFITKHLNTLLVAVDGQVSTTNLASSLSIWRVQTAAQASVWWIQNQSKPFESLTASVYDMLSTID